MCTLFVASICISWRSFQILFFDVLCIFLPKVCGQVLPCSEWHLFKAKIPVRCMLCRSRKQPQGKVVDAVSGKQADINFFLGQHVGGDTHQKLHAQYLASKINASLEEPKPAKVKCQGVSFADDSCGALKGYEEHFKVWLSWKSACPELRKHNYIYQDADDAYQIVHGDCLEECDPRPGRRNTCEKCMALASKDGLRKVVILSAMKKFAADHLHCRLFQSEEVLKTLEAKMKNDVLYLRHRERVTKIIKWKTWQLQPWVRSSFLSVRADRRNPVLQTFLDTVVNPCLAVNATAAGNKKADLLLAQQSFERFLKDPMQPDMAKVQVAVASASLSGRLAGNPLVLGLVLSCLKVLERQEQGKSTHGRVGKDSAMHTDYAEELARESGVMLAVAGGNSSLLHRFGYSPKHMKLWDFASRLEKASLPKPLLSLNDAALHRENMRLIDQMLSGFTQTTGCTSD